MSGSEGVGIRAVRRELDRRVLADGERVPVEPDLVTRWRRRAVRRARHLNSLIDVPTYRWAAVREGRRWAVAAIQLRADDGVYVRAAMSRLRDVGPDPLADDRRE